MLMVERGGRRCGGGELRPVLVTARSSTGQTSDQYWLIFGGCRPSTSHREGAGKRCGETVGDYSPRKAR